MATRKKGFIAKMIEGPERSDSYARGTLPGNRWELGWDLFKSNTGKLIGLNFLTLLFLLPIFMVIFLRYMQVQYSASTGPFSQNVGLGYPGYFLGAGFNEEIYLRANASSLIFLPLAGLIASVGIAGGMYVMRNMVWAEGVFVGKDFWTGVKKNYLVVMLSTLVYTIFLSACIFTISSINFQSAQSGGHWLYTLSNVLSYIMIGFISITYLYMLSMGVTYDLKFRQLIRNAIIMTIALVPTNLFFAAFALVSVIIMCLGNTGFAFGIMIFLFFGLSVAMLIWTNYSQWAFDKFINDKVPGAVKNRGIYSKTPDDEESDFSFERSTLGKRPIKPITDYEIEIIEIPETFSRADLQRLEESKQAMRKASDEYVEDVLSGKISNEAPLDEVESLDDDSSTDNDDDE